MPHRRNPANRTRGFDRRSPDCAYVLLWRCKVNTLLHLVKIKHSPTLRSRFMYLLILAGSDVFRCSILLRLLETCRVSNFGPQQERFTLNQNTVEYIPFHPAKQNQRSILLNLIEMHYIVLCCKVLYRDSGKYDRKSSRYVIMVLVHDYDVLEYLQFLIVHYVCVTLLW